MEYNTCKYIHQAEKFQRTLLVFSCLRTGELIYSIYRHSTLGILHYSGFFTTSL